MACSRILTAITSSTPTPIGWPVKPFVLAMTISLAAWPNTLRSAATSADALPPRAGVKVSCDMNTVSGAMWYRLMPKRRSADAMRLSIVWVTWATSRRVAWNALFRTSLVNNSTTPRIPRSATASWLSTTSAQAPIPSSVPWRRRSNGSAASLTLSSVAAAPVARKPAPIHPSSFSLVVLSAPTTTTRRHRPARIQSSASEMPWAVLAQAALTCAFGPRAPTYSANWLWPIVSTRKRNRRSNWYGSRAIRSSRSVSRRWISRSVSASRVICRSSSRASRCARRDSLV